MKEKLKQKTKTKKTQTYLTALRLTTKPKNPLCFQNSYLHKKDNISTVVYKIGSTIGNNILNYKDVVNSF